MSLLSNVFRPVVADERDLRRYVTSVTLLAWCVAVGADAVNHLLIEGSLPIFLRESLITTVVVLCVAIPIARSMGKAHLALHHAKREAERLSRTDPLTGLANRRAFYEAAARLDRGALALGIADIDRFKRINDRFGHAAGDEVIKSIADRMQGELGDLGVVARVGGEEFALICADCDVGEVNHRLQRFRERVSGEPAAVGGAAIHATVSIGFAARKGAGFGALYAAADQALYAAKSAGRDCVVNYDDIAEIAPGALDLAPLRRAG